MPPTNPGSLEEDVSLEPSTTRSGVTFRPPEIPRVKTTQPAIPSGNDSGVTLRPPEIPRAKTAQPATPPGNDSLELGGPNESQ